MNVEDEFLFEDEELAAMNVEDEFLFEDEELAEEDELSGYPPCRMSGNKKTGAATYCMCNGKTSCRGDQYCFFRDNGSHLCGNKPKCGVNRVEKVMCVCGMGYCPKGKMCTAEGKSVDAPAKPAPKAPFSPVTCQGLSN